MAIFAFAWAVVVFQIALELTSMEVALVVGWVAFLGLYNVLGQLLDDDDT